jgi:hypothetical protein
VSSTMETAMKPEAATDAALAGAVQPVLERRQKMEEGVMRRLQDADARSDALKPPEMVASPQMPQVQATPPEQRWGGVAMAIAAMAGALTRQPLTASLNAMAQVNEAYNKGDLERAQQAYREWQTQSQNALKMNQFRQKAYDEALKKIDSDRHGAIGDLQAVSAAFKDDMITELFATGHTREAMAMLHATSTANAKMAEYQADLEQIHTAIDADRQAHPDLYANPVEANRRIGLIRSHKNPDDEKPETGTQRETELQNKYVQEQEEKFKADPANASKQPTAEQRLAWFNQGKTLGKPEKPETGAQLETDYQQQYVKEQEEKFKADPANAGKSPSAQQRLAWFNEGKNLGKPKTATAARMERFNDLATDDFRKQFQRDPNPEDSGDRVQLERFALGEEAKAKLASSPYIQNLQHLEREAVDRAIENDPSLANDPVRLGRVIAQVSGHKALTGGQLVAIQDHAQRVTHALDDIDTINRGLTTATAVAGGLGPLLRGGEAIENIVGYLPETRRADFRAALSRLQYDAPALLSYRPFGTERAASPLIEDITGNQRWGDTYSNVTSRIGALQQRFVSDLRTLNQEYEGGSGEPLPMLRDSRPTAPTASTAPSGGPAAQPQIAVVTSKEAYDKLPPGAAYRKEGDPPDSHRIKQ